MNIALIAVALLIGAVGLLKKKRRLISVAIGIVALVSAGYVIRMAPGLRNGKEITAPHDTGAGALSSKTPTGRDTAFPLLDLGDGGTIFDFSGPKGQVVIKFIDDNALTVGIDSGRIKVSTLIRNRTGAVVAELTNNEWKTNNQRAFDRNFSKAALEVKDNSGDVVLQVMVLPDRIELQGKLYDRNGNGIAIGRDPRGRGVVTELTSPSHPHLAMKIKPIFLYPGDDHLGQYLGTKPNH